MPVRWGQQGRKCAGDAIACAHGHGLIADRGHAGARPSDPAANPFSTIAPAGEGQFGKSNFSFRINEIIGQDGSRQKRRSIIAGVDVAPGTMVGLGWFDSGPKAKGRGPDPRLDGLSKRSRKAALGMSFRF